MNPLNRAIDIYRQTSKEDDFFWARYPSRPFAALLLAVLRPLRLTPNFITLLSLATGLAACAAFALAPGHGGLWLAWALCQLAFIVDCADGMQARYEKLRSPVGVSFDFLVDEIKQIWLFPAIAWRLANDPGAGIADPLALLGLGLELNGWLVLALACGPLVATGLAMTTFMRSPAFTGKTTTQIREKRGGSPLGLVMKAISFLMNYPSWILLPVALDRMDLFLLVSVPLYTAYIGYALLRISARIVPMTHYEKARAADHGHVD